MVKNPNTTNLIKKVKKKQLIGSIKVYFKIYMLKKHDKGY
jgi:hypothetical protein